MEEFYTKTVVIGAGVVGLAIAKVISEKNNEVIILEKEDKIGQITSSRNSGVIHAGIYYQSNTLKSKFCVEGNQLLYAYAKKFNVPYINTKKLIVANNELQMEQVFEIKNQAELNGVENLEVLDKKKIKILEPLIKSSGGLLVPSTGVIDQHSLMQSYLGEFENNGGMVSYNSEVKKIFLRNKKFKILVQDKHHNQTVIICDFLINAGGIFASDIANYIDGLDKRHIPVTYLAKGNYFSLNKKLPINHLIYPVPEKISLGIHLTLEIDNSIKFGPDAEWVDDPYDYSVKESLRSKFYCSIKKYLPDIEEKMLSPAYSGLRPINSKEDKAKRDFTISTVENHKIENLINLYGIESPGLTSSLAIAKYVTERL
jgi:L-2-hydroxyglutarate oxidase LhgO